MKINTLIIDDNPNWRLTLSKFVEMNPILKLAGVCESAFEAYAKLTEQEIDLLICDIEMPDISGLGLAKSLPDGPLIIFVTSHQEYVLDCYEVSPVDFLLKPLNFERFLQSIEKARKRILSKPEDMALSPCFSEHWQKRRCAHQRGGGIHRRSISGANQPQTYWGESHQ